MNSEKNDGNTLKIFEHKIFRKIFGPIKENNQWRIRMNFELNQLYNDTKLIVFIKY